MGDCRNYEAILPYLNTKEFSYYFIDLRGYGLSKNIKGIFNSSEAITDILKIIKNENLKK